MYPPKKAFFSKNGFLECRDSLISDDILIYKLLINEDINN